jgi:hypothetical protein
LVTGVPVALAVLAGLLGRLTEEPGARVPFVLPRADPGLGSPGGAERADAFEGALALRFGRAPGGACPRAGVERLVDRLTMSLPCTTRLSDDFLRSRVSIVSVGRAHVSLVNIPIGKGGGTVGVRSQLDDIADADVDDTEEALILFLELLLVKDLHCQDGILVDIAADGEVSNRPQDMEERGAAYRSKLSFQ